MKIHDSRIRLTPKGPWMKGRARFSLYRDEIRPDGTRTQKPIDDDRITALNKSYAAGTTTLEEGRLAIFAIKAELAKELKREDPDRPIASYNLEVAERFIKERINSKRTTTLGSKKSAITQVYRCVKDLGVNNLRTIRINDVQEICNSYKLPGAHRHMCMWFNALLKYVGRAEKVVARPKTYVPPSYLTNEQVYLLVNAIPLSVKETHPLMRELILLIYNLGCRLSEALALSRESVGQIDKSVVVNINTQYANKASSATEAERTRLPKNRKERLVNPLNVPETLECLKKWVQAYPDIKSREIYRNKTGVVIKELCQTLFKKNIDTEMDDFFDLEKLPDFNKDRKYKRTHMLRASHAVRLLDIGFPIEGVAKQLGDSIEVTERHYAGFGNNASSVKTYAEMLAKALKQ